jgi:hypothetical protein
MGGGYMNTFPPKFYDRVEFDGKSNKWTWHEEAAKFAKAEAITDLYTMLNDAAKGKNAAMMK